MNKDKETMAREFVLQVNELDGSKASMGMVSFTAHAMIDTYLAGFDAGQAQLLEQASEGFDEYEKEYWDTGAIGGRTYREWVEPSHIEMANLYMRKAWLASALHSAKLLADKDKEIERIKEELEWFKE